MKKKAVISLDVEDWYHLDYFRDKLTDNSQTILEDGINEFLKILEKHEIKSTFFVVGELIENNIKLFKSILNSGHEIAGHSYYHKRPLTQSLEKFQEDCLLLKNALTKNFDINHPGYRAPCFSIDNKRLEILEKLNFSYDSSKISAGFHPLYGNINIDNFDKPMDNIYIKDNFVEYELAVNSFFNQNIPISGGGYLRILPWFFFKYLLNKYIKKNDTYFFFIHPFELTNKKINLPVDSSFSSKLRFQIGRSKGSDRLNKIIDLLKKEDYEFVTFSDLNYKILK